MNKKFQNYKQCKVVFVDDLQLDVQIKATIFQPEISKKKKIPFDRAKVKSETRKLSQDFLDR